MYNVLAVFNAVDNISAVAAGIGNNVGSLSSRVTAFGQNMVTTGTQLTAGLTLPILAAGAAVVGLGTQFESSMTVVRTMTGSSAADFVLYKQKVEELRNIVPQTSNELAQALYFVASAGFRGQEAIDVLTTSAKAAANAMANVQTVAQAVTSVLAAYGLQGRDAGRITDILTMAVIEGKAEFEDLAGSIGRVLPIAAQAGVSFEQVMASLATMTRAGLSADEATTALRAALMSLFAPSKEAQKALDEMGMSADELRSSISERGLLATLQMLMEKTGGNVTILDQLIPNVRGLVGVLATAGAQSEVYAEILDKVTNSLGVTDAAFQATQETARVQLALTRNALEGLALVVAAQVMPKMLELASGFRDWLLRMQETDPQVLQMIITIAALAAGIGPLLILLGALATGIGALLSPVGLVVAAIVALALAWVTNWNGMRETLEPIVTRAVELFQVVANWLQVTIPAAITALQSWWGTAWPAIQSAAETAWTGIQSTAEQVLGVVVPFIQAQIASVRAWFEENWPLIQCAAQQAWETIQRITNTVLGEVVPFIQSQLTVIRTWFEDNWGLIQRTVETVWAAIQTVVVTVSGVIGGVISAFLALVAGWWSEHGTQVLSLVQNAWTLIQTAVDTAINLVLGIIRTVMLVITGDWQGAWQQIQSLAETVWNALLTLVQTTGNLLLGVIQLFLQTAQSVWETVWGVIQSVAETVWGALQEAATSIFGAIQTFLDTTWANIQTAVQSTWGQIQTWLGTTWGSIQMTAQTVYSAIQTFLATTWANIQTAAQSTWAQIQSWLGTTWGSIQTTAQTVYSAIQTFLGTTWANIQAAVQSTWGQIQSWLDSTWSAIYNLATTTFHALKTYLNAKWVEIKTGVEAKWNDIKDWLDTTWSAIYNLATTTFHALKTYLNAKWVEIKGAVETKWDEIKQAIGDKWDAIKRLVGEKLDEVKRTISGFSLTSVGEGLIDGLKQGVLNRVGSLISAVVSAITEAINAARTALGIESPSTVFIEIGQRMMEGLAIGVSSAVGAATNALLVAFGSMSKELVERAGDAAQTVLDIMRAVTSLMEGLGEVASYGGASGLGAGLDVLEADLGAVVDTYVRVAEHVEQNRDLLVATAPRLKEVFESLAATFGALELIRGYQSLRGAGALLDPVLEVQQDLIAVSNAMQQLVSQASVRETTVDYMEKMGRFFEHMKTMIENIAGAGEQQVERVRGGITNLWAVIQEFPPFLVNTAYALGSSLPMAIEMFTTAQLINTAILSTLRMLVFMQGEEAGQASGLLAEFLRVFTDFLAVMRTGLVGLYEFLNVEFRGMLASISWAAEGANMGQTLADGILSAVPAVAAAAAALASAATSAVDDVLEIASPSRAMMRRGIATAQGFLLGLGMVQPAMAFAPAMAQAGASVAGRAGGTPVVQRSETHLHVGVLVADEQGLRELERRLRPVREQEEARRGNL